MRSAPRFIFCRPAHLRPVKSSAVLRSELLTTGILRSSRTTDKAARDFSPQSSNCPDPQISLATSKGYIRALSVLTRAINESMRSENACLWPIIASFSISVASGCRTAPSPAYTASQGHGPLAQNIDPNTAPVRLPAPTTSAGSDAATASQLAPATLPQLEARREWSATESPSGRRTSSAGRCCDDCE